MTSMQRPSKMLTLKELARYLALSERTVYRLVEDGTLPALKVGGQWRFERKSLEAWVAAAITNNHRARPKASPEQAPRVRPTVSRA